mmetsp:Transcript_50661/g.120935  ORF Transcript_50661/g.120935 Transcript_50661/m.120935 type:complete len:235 (-) Transcript_50661:450-1154(-)
MVWPCDFKHFGLGFCLVPFFSHVKLGHQLPRDSHEYGRWLGNRTSQCRSVQGAMPTKSPCSASIGNWAGFVAWPKSYVTNWLNSPCKALVVWSTVFGFLILRRCTVNASMAYFLVVRMGLCKCSVRISVCTYLSAPVKSAMSSSSKGCVSTAAAAMHRYTSKVIGVSRTASPSSASRLGCASVCLTGLDCFGFGCSGLGISVSGHAGNCPALSPQKRQLSWPCAPQPIPGHPTS